MNTLPNLDSIRNLTSEQMDKMSTDELNYVRTKIALVSLHTHCSFLDVALDNGKLSQEDAVTVVSVDKLITAMLTRLYPNRKW